MISVDTIKVTTNQNMLGITQDGKPILAAIRNAAEWFRDFHPIERALTGRTNKKGVVSK
jgi:hypothetical protein